MPGMESTPEMFDLRMSEANRPLFDAVTEFVREEIDPVTARYHQLGAQREEHWGYHPQQLEILDGLKQKAKDVRAAIHQPWRAKIQRRTRPPDPFLTARSSTRSSASGTR